MSLPVARRPIAGLLGLLALLSLSACGFNRELARQAERAVAAEQPRHVECERADHCAIDSPYRELLARAQADSRPDAPVHYLNLLEVGEDSLALRVHLIRSARHSIDMQTFIWAQDDAGWLMLDELVAAARRGVRVRVLADQLFSLDNVDWLARIARAHANLEFRLYNPTFHDAVTQPLEFAAGVLCCFSRFNQRMHNKLLLVDGGIGIAGGRNVENRYFDWDEKFDYRDRDALVLGAGAGAEMQASFEQFWRHPRSTPLTRLNDVNRKLLSDSSEGTALPAPASLDAARIARLRQNAGDADYIRAQFIDTALRVGRVDYFSDSPDKPSRPKDPAQAELTARIVKLLRSARSQVMLETPYLVLSPRARAVFRELRKREANVSVVVSTNSLAATDAFYVYALSYKYKKRYLKRYGFQIHEFKPFPADAERFVRNYAQLAGGDDVRRYQRYERPPVKSGGVRLGLHAKSIVIDDRIVLIGSHNFDPRSDDLNTESGFIIHDRAAAMQVRAAIGRNIAPGNAWTIARRPPRGPKVVRKLNNVIATVSTALPLFDVWPFRYATSYELLPGCEPLPPADPRFLDCYADVGDFPEVDLPLKTIYTRIVTAFGAGFAGFL